jgi:hypothetical protein
MADRTIPLPFHLAQMLIANHSQLQERKCVSSRIRMIYLQAKYLNFVKQI